MSRILSPNLEYALGWTVVHSLWQATAIALLVAVLMIALRKRAAQTRYIVSCAGLFTTFISAIVTFCIYFDFSNSVSEDGGQIIEQNTLKDIVLNKTKDLVEISSSIGFREYFNQHLPLIVSVWLMGVALFTLRLLSGVSYITYLKRYRNSPMHGEWQARVEYLCEQLGVIKAVEIFESALVKTPMTIGSLKPIILFPIGAVCHLSVEQVEAILAHELAHIRRKDYLFNILQSIVEILFYFHPAVWWLSNTIRNERENCCDDIAVSISGNSLSYAKALVNLQELHAQSPMLAMGFSGKSSKNQLLNRVKRLLNQPQSKSNIMEKLVATCFLLLVLVFTSFSENSDNKLATENTLNTETPEQQSEVCDSSKFSQHRSNSYKNGLGTFTYIDDKENVKWQMRDGEIVHLNINGKEISEKKFPNYYASLKRWKTSIPELIIDSLPNHPISNDFADFSYSNGKDKYHYVIEKGEITHLNVNGKEIPKEQFGEYREFLEKKDAFLPIPPTPPVPPVPPVSPVPPTPPSFNKFWSSNSNFNKNYSKKITLSPKVHVDVNPDVAISLSNNAMMVANQSLLAANDAFQNTNFNFSTVNDDKCNPCDEQRMELKNQLKDIINKIQEFDTEDAKDAGFYQTKAAQIREIKRKLNNTNIQSDEVDKIRKEMRQIRTDMEDFDDSGDELYPNKKTKYGWQSGFEQELRKDGYIKDGTRVHIMMNSSNEQLIVNDRWIQNREVYLKYEKLYQQLTGSKLRRTRHIEYNKE